MKNLQRVRTRRQLLRVTAVGAASVPFLALLFCISGTSYRAEVSNHHRGGSATTTTARRRFWTTATPEEVLGPPPGGLLYQRGENLCGLGERFFRSKPQLTAGVGPMAVS